MLQEQIESLFDKPPERYSDQHLRLFQQFKDGLNDGSIRAAEPDASIPTGWRVNSWVKKGILLGFRMGAVVAMSHNGAGQAFFDKATYPLKSVSLTNAVRIVPGGSSPSARCQ
jgi:2,3,4,5-tetrahydropyridine-2-carboxylate N-succinyltransferase